MRPLIGLLLFVGCGSSSVTLQFQNARASASHGLKATHQGLNDRAPSSFGMKLVAVYLAEDVDPQTQNNVGQTPMIYLNPSCDDDISHCELGPGTSHDDGRPYSHFVTDYFDFNADSATVNAALNAQGRSIEPGTYRYARMEFCKDNLTRQPTVRWGVDGSTHDFVWGGCGVTSAPFTQPLEIRSGDTVTVTLSYDLATSVSDVDSNGRVTGVDCLTTPTGRSCFQPPPFEPSAQLVH